MQAFAFCVARNMRRNKRYRIGAKPMDWLQFSAAMVASLAWPAAVVILTAMLRSPLAKIILMVKSLSYKEFHIALSDRLEAVKEEVDAHAPLDQPTPPYLTPPSVLELAHLDPRAAVFSAWIDVERALMEMASKAGISPNGTPVTIANELHIMDALSEFEFETFRNLRRVRNDAVHLTNKDVSSDDAVTMAHMCQWLTHRIRMITAGLPPIDSVATSA